MKKFAVVLLFMAFAFFASAQTSQDPQGYISYALPSTVITLDVEAVQETFYAGPYAKYAEKYLGIKVRTKDENTVQLTQIKMTPLIEADLGRRYAIDASKKGFNPSAVLKLSSTGLVSFVDASSVEESVWRFPLEVNSNFSDKGLSSNLTSESATLYRNEKKETVYNRVSVQQDMVVAKSLEQKAAEAADTILELRRHRLQIVTGDTDATYSGEAMAAALEELERLEKEYMTLFAGYSQFQNQRMKFDVIPEAGRENQMYIAFRLSDTKGLVPADDLTGKPVIMEIVAQEISQSGVNKRSGSDLIYYRIPNISIIKLKEGTDLLLQGRVPIYQLGQESSVPLSTILN